MKKFFVFLFLVCVFLCTYYYRNDIIFYIMRNFVDKDISFGEANSYYKDIDYVFVQNTDSLFAANRQDILNIIYSTLNRGLDEIYFYCDYDGCTDDVNSIAEDSNSLAHINNFVHPYNNYNKIYFTISKFNKISIKIDHIYSPSSILLVNNEIDKISNSIIDSSMSDYDKIKAFHDYIINNTSYDSTVSIESQKYIQTNSSNAIGLLFEGKAICSGYSDVMAIFLNRLGINNYKISSDSHIWNLVNYNGSWLHIDATWDDPVTNDGSSVLLSDFFLINSNSILSKDSELNRTDHAFDKQVYTEAN